MLCLTSVGGETVSGGGGEAAAAQASQRGRGGGALKRALLAAAVQLHVAAAHLAAHPASQETTRVSDTRINKKVNRT